MSSSSSNNQDGGGQVPAPTPDPAADAAAESQSLKGSAATASTAYTRSLQAKKTRVLVLGAGMSGLACARELRQRGYQVLVVEARDRLGGRLKGGVKTNDKEGGNEGMKTLPNSFASPESTVLKPVAKSRNNNKNNTRNKKDTTTAVDLGGALIHGIIGNPIYDITEQMGIPTVAVADCLLFNGSGWPVDTREDERIATIFNDCLEETFRRVAASAAAAASDIAVQPPTTSTNTVAASAATAEAVDNNVAEPTSAGSTTTSISTAEAAATGTIATTLPRNEEDNEKQQSPVTISPPMLSEDISETIPGDKVGESKQQPVANTTGASSEIDSNIATTSLEESNPLLKSGTALLDASAPFGDVFEQVCAEKGAPTSYPLFQWQQANLEVGCGASFPGLGHKWNDDEPYGFDGNHNAVRTSWKPVMEGLADGIDVLYQSPVKQVVMVVPDLPTATLQQPEAIVVTTPAPLPPDRLSVPPQFASPPSSSMKNKRKRPTPSAKIPLPNIRKSRRISGDDVNARRSSRANKGQKVERFQVAEFSNTTYDVNQLLEQSRKKKEEGDGGTIEDVHTTVQVTLEDGTVLEAEAVVCTVPLGVLKLDSKGKKKEDSEEIEEFSGGGIQFYPSLSERKVNAIQRLGCGLLNKCVLSFPHVFWQASDFLGLAHPAKSYLVLNTATFTNKPILTFMYGGTFAKEIESWSDNEIVADCMEVLKIICGRDIPNPLDYAVTRWGHEQYSRMSFSYVPPGVNGTQEYKAMSEAVYDPNVPRKPVIMFAGEHTTQFHPSTIHGAFLSGIREAYRLDLIMEAEANGNLKFDDDHTYQYTFGVRRQFQSVKSPVARAPRLPAAPKESPEAQVEGGDTKPSESIRQHRRRGAAGGVNLRERPVTILPEVDEGPIPSTKKRQSRQLQLKAIGPSISPAKRSRRSVHSIQNENTNIIPLLGTPPATLKNAPTTEAEALVEKKHLASLESRTLVRALESYGHNYEYISSLVLPIFGNAVPNPPKTLPQVRARCQQLIRSIMSTASTSISSKQLASWEAKEVFEPPPPDQKPIAPAKKRRQSAPPEPRVEGSRKSSRQQKERDVLDL